VSPSEQYRLELNAYAAFNDEENCDLCADHFYGKFLNYINNKDYVGASLTKKFLMRGDWHCSQNGHRNNKFISFYNQALENEDFKKIKSDFFHDGMGEQKRETKAAFS
jgi:hypothetical protein